MQYGLGFVSGTLAGSVVPLASRARVGSDSVSEVRLDEAPVAAQHAQLYLEGHTYTLVDLSSDTGTYIDGERVTPGQAVPIQPGNLLMFGEGGPLALFEIFNALRLGVEQAELILSREDPPGGSWLLNGPNFIGRSDACHIQLDPERDTLASSRHVHVMPAFGQLIVTDMGSANGTYMDGRRVSQRAIAPGNRIHLGGEAGPCFRNDGVPSQEVAALSSSQIGPPPIPENFELNLRWGEERARIQVACKTEVLFGSFAGLNDFETVCFPRELESESDAMERSEPIGPQHGSLVLTPDGIDLCDGGYAPTKLNGSLLPKQERAPLGAVFELWLGDDSVGLRGRLFRHPNLAPTAPAIGMQAQHPVECLAMERMGDGPDSQLYLFLVRQASIGSSEDAVIHLPFAGVGDLHALLYLQDEALWITQLGPDPIAVNGTPLSPGTTVPLSPGCEFFVGTVMFRLDT